MTKCAEGCHSLCSTLHPGLGDFLLGVVPDNALLGVGLLVEELGDTEKLVHLLEGETCCLLVSSIRCWEYRGETYPWSRG